MLEFFYAELEALAPTAVFPKLLLGGITPALADRVGRHLEQPASQRRLASVGSPQRPCPVAFAKAKVMLALSQDGGRRDAQLLLREVGDAEADAADVAGEEIGVLVITRTAPAPQVL